MTTELLLLPADGVSPPAQLGTGRFPAPHRRVRPIRPAGWPHLTHTDASVCICLLSQGGGVLQEAEGRHGPRCRHVAQRFVQWP